MTRNARPAGHNKTQERPMDYVPPTADEVRAILASLDLTQTEAGSLVHAGRDPGRGARRWATGERAMQYPTLYTLAHRAGGRTCSPDTWRQDLADLLIGEPPEAAEPAPNTDAPEPDPARIGVALSKRQVGDADRVGGLELLILWPSWLAPEPADLGLGEERDATPAEQAAAEMMLTDTRATWAAHGTIIVPVHTRVAKVRRPAGLPAANEVRAHLAITLIGQRWVHASTRKAPRTAFAASA
jgi:hypothetical protein